MSHESAGLSLLAIRIANRIGRPLGINPFPRAFPNPLVDEVIHAAEAFDEVYRRNYWGSAQSRSGVGSETSFTSRYRAALAILIRTRGFCRIFDAPCGDINWMGPLIAEIGIEYVGGDISSLAVRDAQNHYPLLDLRVFDITSDPFPQVDVWHCRDCLFHLPLLEIRRAFENFISSNIPYALLTTHKSRLCHRNLDVTVGGFRYLDLEAAPIGLPKAEVYLPDYRWGKDFPRYVGLWSRDAITDALVHWKTY